LKLSYLTQAKSIIHIKDLISIISVKL